MIWCFKISFNIFASESENFASASKRGYLAKNWLICRITPKSLARDLARACQNQLSHVPKRTPNILIIKNV